VSGMYRLDGQYIATSGSWLWAESDGGAVTPVASFTLGHCSRRAGQVFHSIVRIGGGC